MSDSAGPTPPAGQGTPAVVRRAPAADPFMRKKRRFVRGDPPPPTSRPAPQTTSQSTTNGIKSAPQAKPETASPGFQEYDIVISKPFGAQGLRFHGIKFQAKPNRDGTIASVDPYSEEQFTRPLRLHRRYARDKQIQAEEANGPEDKERELHNQRRAERQAEREANQAQIAPSGNKKLPMKRRKGQKNVEDVYFDETNPKQQKAAQLRYEETKPWHLEDFGNGTTPKNVWVGAYQEPLSESSVLFDIRADGFYVVPVERWYSFRQTDKINILNSDEVEKQMSRKYNPGRWYLNTHDKNDEIKREMAEKRRRAMEDDDVKPRAQLDSYRADLDELDFEAKDEFQDDDEGHIFGDDEEMANEVEKKVREEMREANLPSTNMKNDDKDYDAEEDQERADRKAQRKLQKKLRKRIVKHEKKYEYDSDSEHPYSESSEDDESDEERQRIEDERKKEEAVKMQLSGNISGGSGRSTPAHRAEKREPIRLAVAGSLKRSGSPLQTDLAKRARLTPQPLGGHRSVENSGDESRSSSPHPPTVAEILAAIPAAGISIKDLGNTFRKRISKQGTKEFIKLVKENTYQDPVTKLLKAGSHPPT